MYFCKEHEISSGNFFYGNNSSCAKADRAQERAS